MKAFVTALSASVPDIAAAAAATVAYVCGPQEAVQLAAAANGSAPVAYYADSTVEGPGRWLGAGAPGLGLGGLVDREDLQALLCGEHPTTGEALLDARGSTLRAAGDAPSVAPTWDQERYTFAEAAALLRVDARHLRRVAGRTRALVERTGGNVDTMRAIEADGRAFLFATHGDDNKWRVDRDELQRFHSERRIANVVTGYDVTFSAPKSVSVLWAASDASARAAIVDSIDAAVDAGMQYLERQCAFSGRGIDRIAGRGLTAAAFTHGTSRNLDPQLHTHVLVANVVDTPAGHTRALYGAGLFAHAKTAGYLAAAALRHELTQRLGVAWRPVRSGIAEVAGIPTAAIEAMSSRRAEIDARALELDIHSAAGRKEVALRTRAPKTTATDLDELRTRWRDQLEGCGLNATTVEHCVGRQDAVLELSEHETDELFADLTRHDGLTANSSTFDRRDVIQAIVDSACERLDAPSVERLADQFLASPLVVALDEDIARRTSTRRHPRARRAIATVPEQRFSTPLLVRAECEVVSTFRTGLRSGSGVVDADIVRRALGDARDLAREQRSAVRQLCRSGHQIHCLVGPAGSGKTHTLRTATRAWNEAGHQALGLAVQGTAAEHLGQATGIPTETVAAFLARAERADSQTPVLDDHTIVVLDEASALGTFDFERLTRIARAARAKLVLVGDPAQHGAVAAGGAFAALVRHHPTTCAQLEVVHRHDESLAAARVAIDELRHRDTDSALHRLAIDDRITSAQHAEDAYTSIVHDWYADRVARNADPSLAPSCMITEHHATRRELIERARSLLHTSGELEGPTLTVAGQEFQAGDEVMSRCPARDLHPANAPELYLRNGTPGRVTAVQLPDPGSPGGLWVECDGRGTVFIPVAALEREIRPGTTGVLTHSYALTSHAAQGATFETARAIASEATTPAALYVAASRARSDLHIYAMHQPGAEEPEVAESLTSKRPDPRNALQALTASVRTRSDEVLAIELDPTLTRLAPDADALADLQLASPTPTPAPLDLSGPHLELGPPPVAVVAEVS